MKAPVLVVASTMHARAIQSALANDFSVTVTEDPRHGDALASTRAFLAVILVGVAAGTIRHAIVVEPDADALGIRSAVVDAVARLAREQRHDARSDLIGVVPYDDYIELAHYAATRRYLMALLGRHAGSVTDAARDAKMKRESLHRLLRRHHVSADDFRDHT